MVTSRLIVKRENISEECTQQVTHLQPSRLCQLPTKCLKYTIIPKSENDWQHYE